MYLWQCTSHLASNCTVRPEKRRADKVYYEDRRSSVHTAFWDYDINLNSQEIEEVSLEFDHTYIVIL